MDFQRVLYLRVCYNKNYKCLENCLADQIIQYMTIVLNLYKYGNQHGLSTKHYLVQRELTLRLLTDLV